MAMSKTHHDRWPALLRLPRCTRSQWEHITPCTCCVQYNMDETNKKYVCMITLCAPKVGQAVSATTSNLFLWISTSSLKSILPFQRKISWAPSGQDTSFSSLESTRRSLSLAELRPGLPPRRRGESHYGPVRKDGGLSTNYDFLSMRL